MSDDEYDRLVQPGFSTRAQVLGSRLLQSCQLTVRIVGLIGTLTCMESDRVRGEVIHRVNSPVLLTRLRMKT